MQITFLTASPGSVLFSRSNLLKRKDLCFSCLRLGLIRHRRSLRSSHLSSQVLHDLHRVTLESNQKAIRDRSSKVETRLALCADRHRMSLADLEMSWHRRWGTLIQPVADAVEISTPR
jgi:hypothetical protein